MTPETRGLAHHAHLIIHEAFKLSRETPGHGTVSGCLEMAQDCRAKKLALVHIQREVRKERIDEIRELSASIQGLQIFIPAPGDRLRI